MAAGYHPSFNENYRAFQNRGPWAMETRNLLHRNGQTLDCTFDSAEHWSEDRTMSFLSYLQSLHASDSRDKIFSVHEILRSTGLYVESPDYNQLPHELFKQVTMSVMKSRNSLRHLEYFLRPSSSALAPSWVIDWSPDTHAAGYYLKTARATRNSKPWYNISANAQILSVRGTVVGHIQHCKDASHTLWPGASTLKQKILARIPSSKRAFFASLLRLMECVSIVRQMRNSTKPEGELQCIMVDTVDLLVHDLLPRDVWKSLPAEAKTPFLDRLHSMMAATDEAAINEALREEHPQNDSNDSRYLENIADVWQNVWADVPAENTLLNVKHIAMIIASLGKHNRTLVVLDTGHICPVHTSCLKGDAIALIAGLDYPMLLRPTTNDQYRVVCTAWICGAMDGNLWPDDDLKLTQLDIT